MKEANVGSVMCSYNRAQRPVRVREPAPARGDPASASGASRASCSPTTARPRTPAHSLNNGLDFDPWPGVAYSPPLVNAALAAGQAEHGARRRARARASCARCSPTASSTAPPTRDDDAPDRQAGPRAGPRSEIEEAAITLLREPRRRRCRSTPAKLQVDRADRRRRRRRSRPAAARATSTPFAVDDAARRRSPSAPARASTVALRRRHATPARAAALARRPPTSRSSFAGDYQTEGADQPLPDAPVPAVQRRPGRR